MPAGQPTKFTPELLEIIFQEIAQGASEFSCFNREGRPTWQAWTGYKRRQLEAENKGFFAKYAGAKEDCFEVWEHRIVAVSHDDSRDQIETITERLNNAGEVIARKVERKSDNTAVNRDRLKTDSLKWIMSKLGSKKYGDKLTQEVSGKDGSPLIPVLNITVQK